MGKLASVREDDIRPTSHSDTTSSASIREQLFWILNNYTCNVTDEDIDEAQDIEAGGTIKAGKGRPHYTIGTTLRIDMLEAIVAQEVLRELENLPSARETCTCNVCYVITNTRLPALTRTPPKEGK